MKTKTLFRPSQRHQAHYSHSHRERTQRSATPHEHLSSVAEAGLRQKVYCADELGDMYDQCEEFWKTVESRLITVALLVDPTYVPRSSLWPAAGDKLSDIRHNLRMAIRGLWKAYATKNWQLGVFLLRSSEPPIYLLLPCLAWQGCYDDNHDNIACGDTFIAPERQNFVWSSKKPVSK